MSGPPVPSVRLAALLSWLAVLLTRIAVRRWPAELAADLEREWLAELDAMRAKPLRQLTFAGSLAISPAIDGPTWQDRARAVTTPVVLTLLAAALFNGVRLAGVHGGQLAAGTALVFALATMGWAGRRTSSGGVILLGACLYAFLLAGNPVAVMPFMGWRDAGPAVVTWTVATALLVRTRSRTIAVAGTLIALDLAVAAGSAHAALALGVPLSSAPLWLLQILVPGSGDPVLIGNAAAMTGALALVSAYVLMGLIRSKPARLPRARAIPAGVTAALVSVAIGEFLRRTPRAIDTAFGFGFLSLPAGVAVTALVVALAAAYHSPVGAPLLNRR
ncbi:hypothetical protein GCM10010435_51260 [Winogradskya consettensis]|uniref:Uncharacterized protein n=1 Tax=Winogradskya consettensis TaxID=113560 RepID=A0A919SJB4_9ACTN|nr:hypothetical protein [Actinoplanes consettensis]GIM72008.1 hypothetical protein Aco04nite_28170 [Actinoplanes consettensis]